MVKSSLDEFELIRKYFNNSKFKPHNKNIILGNGDDCSLVLPFEDKLLAQSIDSYVSNVHFPSTAPADLIGYRALAASLSDLAAIGASPHSFFLSLTIPFINENFISLLAKGINECSKRYNINLLGGDTTKGPLALTFHVQGFVDKNKILKRSEAKIGDKIFISGDLGDSGGALPFILKGDIYDESIMSAKNKLLKSYYYPKPQIDLATKLASCGVKCAIDISDGFLADLNHILTASDVGACIDIKKLPISSSLKLMYTLDKCYEMAMSSGDDYQLCFCLPSNVSLPVNNFKNITEIGYITKSNKLTDVDNNVIEPHGFKHF